MSRRLLFVALIGVAGVAILIALGQWQLQRLAWKSGVLSEIEARLAAAPEGLPDAPVAAVDRFRPVALTGTISADEILVQSSLKGRGPGFLVIAPFEAEGGRRVLIDRGFIPVAARDAARPAGQAEIAGNLHWPDEVDAFTPDPNREAKLWFARDIASMAAELETEPVLGVVRDSSLAVPGLVRLPLGTAGIPNNHLSYAVQWFLLAAVWAGMTGYYLVSQRRTGGKA